MKFNSSINQIIRFLLKKEEFFKKSNKSGLYDTVGIILGKWMAQ